MAARAPHEPTRTGALIDEVGELTRFSGRALLSTTRAPRYLSEILRQLAILVRTSTLVIGVMTALIGFAAITFAYYFLRSVGAADVTGLFAGIAIPRITTVVMFGYVFAAKVGCGLVAEIGARKIGDEVEGLHAEGVDPVRYLVGTRILATFLFLPIAAAAGVIGCFIGGYVDAVIILKASSSGAYLNDYWGYQSLQDQLFALINMGTIAVAIVLVATFYGMRASGGPAGVGAVVARSLVVNLMLVHIISGTWLTLFYGTDLRLPIGG